MKKNVFFALFALAALVFVGCNPDTPTPTPTPDDPTTEGAVITVTPEALLMGVGEEQKLTTTVAPQGTQLQITWTSDNQEVATVNAAGIVTAVAAGKANIIASAEGATADTCVVTVSNDAVLDNFVLGGYGLFGDPVVITGHDTVINGYDCKLVNLMLLAWDNNLVFVEGQGFTGDGFMVVNDNFPAYVVVIDNEVAGLVGSDGFIVSDKVTDVVPYAVPAGKLVDEKKYGDGWKGLLFAETEEAGEAALDLYLESHTGTQLLEVYDGQIYVYIAANVNYALFYDDEETGEMRYDLSLGWYDFVNTDRWYGLACTTAVTEDGKLSVESIVEPYDIRVINKDYSNIPVGEEVAAKTSVMRPMTNHFYVGQNPLRNMKNTKVMYKK